jgi:hypothetical protein
VRLFLSLLSLSFAACVTSSTPPDASGADLGASDLGVTDLGPPRDGAVDAGPPPTCAELMPIDMGLMLGGGDGDGGLARDLGFALVVGLEDTTTGGSVGTPWNDGDTVELVHGFQGGWMVTPSVDVDTTADVPLTADGYACFDVYLTNAVPGAMSVAPLYSAGVLARPVTGRPHVFHVGTQLDFLDYDPTEVDGHVLTLGVRVMGPSGMGMTTRMLTPRMTMATP